MPKKCEHCGFFHPDNDLTDCPDCGQKLKFTMFAPPSFQPQRRDESPQAEAWDVKRAAYEQLELPIGVRISQIVGGITIYFLISRTVQNIFLSICFGGDEDLRLEQIVIGALLIMLVFHVIGALVGGAVAGAWSVNWVPQGIGVGVGVLLLPFFIYFLFGQIGKEGLLGFLVLVCVTTVISVFGAFIGHLLVRPSRFIIS
jgi:hypothetical protein